MRYIENTDILLICFRLILAFLLGGFIGLEREKKTRSAGFRTYSLVCLGSSLAMLVGYYANGEMGYTGDVTRIGAQVISGIGFLGAGAIINSRAQKVIGLTTAAALWTCACIGLAVGIGLYSAAIISCLIVLVLLRVLCVVDKHYRAKSHFVDLYLELFSASKINEIVQLLTDNKISVVSLNSSKPKVESSEIGLELTVVVTSNQNSTSLIELISQLQEVSLVHKVYM